MGRFEPQSFSRDSVHMARPGPSFSRDSVHMGRPGPRFSRDSVHVSRLGSRPANPRIGAGPARAWTGKKFSRIFNYASSRNEKTHGF